MNPNNVLGELIEKGQNTASAAVSDVADSVSNQVGLKNEIASQVSQTQSQSQSQDQAQQEGESAKIQTERTKEMVRDFYSPSEDLVQNNAQKATEEQQLASVRQKLFQEQHNETYYEPLFAYEHSANKTESKAEELEKEKQQEIQQLEQKEADKPPPLAVSRAQTHIEVNPGIAG